MLSKKFMKTTARLLASTGSLSIGAPNDTAGSRLKKSADLKSGEKATFKCNGNSKPKRIYS